MNIFSLSIYLDFLLYWKIPLLFSLLIPDRDNFPLFETDQGYPHLRGMNVSGKTKHNCLDFYYLQKKMHVLGAMWELKPNSVLIYFKENLHQD